MRRRDITFDSLLKNKNCTFNAPYWEFLCKSGTQNLMYNYSKKK